MWIQIVIFLLDNIKHIIMSIEIKITKFLKLK